MDCLLTEYGEPLLAEDGECIEVSRPAGRRYTAEQAQAEWESRQKWRKRAETLLTVKPVVEQEPALEVVQEAIEDILPRLYEPVESLAELVADARLLQLDEARALESAMAVKDVLAIAELAYLAEVAVQQEKDAIAAFIMFMD